MVQADPREFTRALEGIDFPTSRDAIVRGASDKGGLNNEILFILEQIPDQTYETEADLMTAVDEAYTATGGLAGGKPAAPAPTQVKSDAAAGAETEDHSAA